MAFQVVDIEETPNPNAAKFNLDGRISRETESFLRPEDAAGRDALAEALFAIPGVTGVMFCRDFVTINKTANAKWAKITAKVKSTLAEAEREPVAAEGGEASGG